MGQNVFIDSAQGSFLRGRFYVKGFIMTPEEIRGRVLHRDGLILVIDKPAGLAVHKGPGGGDHLEAYLKYLTYGIRHIPALGHRLDQDTSGCLALGRNPKGLKKLGKLFREGLVEKKRIGQSQAAPRRYRKAALYCR